VRSELTTHALSAIPNFKHPVVQKQLSQTASQLQTMHPDATPQEIAQMTIEYFQELTGALQDPKAAKNTEKPADGPRGEDYWNEYWAAADKQGDS
jgi:hypothetical protein